METSSSPLVSVLTPVHNGAASLTKCIESVLAQTYSNWEYIVVNNCSSDESLAIAQGYAARDPRIRVIDNDRFLGKVANHNRAIRQMAPRARYCKFVFANDWLYPTCIEDLVCLAEREPSIGLAGGYTTDGRSVLWHGPPSPSDQVPGRDVCRDMLLGGQYVLGSMSSLLIRTDLIRKRACLFDERNPHREMAACFDILQESNYGYIHQVVSYRGPRSVAENDLDSCILGRISVYLRYGQFFLTEAEYTRYWKQLCSEYHRVLARSVLRVRPEAYFRYHAETLAAFGGGIDQGRLVASILAELAGRASRPLYNIRKGWDWWSQALSRRSARTASA